MNSSPFCAQCGSQIVSGLCPRCGTFHTLASVNGANRKGLRTLKILFVMGAVYLAASAALLVFVGQRMIRNAARLADSPSRKKAFALQAGHVARVDELQGSGRIYLIQVGEHKSPYSLEDFAQWLHTKYALDVQVLPATVADKSAWDAERKQYVAELLYEQIKREHPDLAADPKAYLIGFTDFDMYTINHRWFFTFTQRDLQRTAMISAHRMQDYRLERNSEDANTANQHFQARLRRILLKNVAILYWHLPTNNNPSSLLQQPLDPDVPIEEIYESDLDPASTGWGQSEGEPCMFFSYSPDGELKPLPGTLLRTCSDKNLPMHDESAELFEFDLRLGLLINRHTDFDLPDSVPIQFQRATRDGWSGSNPFGISGTDNYDEFLQSADNVNISVVHSDGGQEGLVRVPAWLPILKLVKYIDTDYSGKYYEMRWQTSPFEHYDLKRWDGAVKTYLPCDSPKVICYLTGIRNAQGQPLKFERDAARRLTQLTSPNGSWLRLSYGPSSHIVEIDDSRGRSVRYGYDVGNRLTTVTYPSGAVFHYEYDSTQHLLTFSVAPDEITAPRLMLRNEYTNGRVTKQIFANGDSYTYNYTQAKNGSISAVNVQAPDGRVFNIDVGEESSIVRVHAPQPLAQEARPANALP